MLQDIELSIMRLKLMLESRATGKFAYDDNEYVSIRNDLISNSELKEYVPEFLQFCDTMDIFWIHIKNEFKSYDKRRIFLNDSFRPLLDYVKNGVTFKEVNVNKNEILIEAMRLKLMLESRATGKFDYDDNEYISIRNDLISNSELKEYVPDFLQFCDTMDIFWIHIKNEFKSYDKRRVFLNDSFRPLLNNLKGISYASKEKNSAPKMMESTSKFLVKNKSEQTSIKLNTNSTYEYDVALSFAGENRKEVEEIAKELKNNDISVFYDEFEKTRLWGNKLDQYFRNIYSKNTRFVIPFISEHYPSKDWTNFEFTIAHAEAKIRDSEFILPVRLDNTLLVGLPSTVHFLDYNKEGKNGIVEKIIAKLKM